MKQISKLRQWSNFVIYGREIAAIDSLFNDFGAAKADVPPVSSAPRLLLVSKPLIGNIQAFVANI